VFHGAGAAETPSIGGDGVGEMGFEDADGREGFAHGLAEFGVVTLFAREGDMERTRRSEPVIQSISANGLPSGGGGRAGFAGLGIGKVQRSHHGSFSF